MGTVRLVGPERKAIVENTTQLLTDKNAHFAMANAVKRVLRDADLAHGLRHAALREVKKYSWAQVRQRWIEVYALALARPSVETRLT